MYKTTVILLLLLSAGLHAQNVNQSPAYQEVMHKYRELDSISDESKIFTYGRTDCGEPLSLFVISQTRIFDPSRLHELNKCILFINNAIHPGEPDGIDASIRLVTDLISKPLYKRMLENVVVCIIPVFNIDGALDRGCCSRVNQNGPEEYGFRANSKNLDLNRDFIKCDARNTRSLINILRKWNPDVMVDTHVSDGADYQYSMTLISSQHSKLNPSIGNYIKDDFTPALFDKMKERNDEMSPYVNIHGEFQIPDSGITSFFETPRYLGGYTSLFNNFSFISESHMLKPFYKRVNSTYNLLCSVLEICDEKKDIILQLREKANQEDLKMKTYKYNWEIDTTRKETIEFKGYEAGQKPSRITGKPRLYYNHENPYKKNIPFYDSYKPTDSISIPDYFFIPQAWEEIVKLLELNDVSIIRINKDSDASVTATYIESYETVKEPYEGHYLHHNIKTRTESLLTHFQKGDYLIPMPQKNMRFVLETLVPDAVDSYFCWGFFDSYLQQKEWFSSYVYEDIAAGLLENNKTLKTEFENWKKLNPDADSNSQLTFIYRHSPNFEKSYKRYPVFSVYK